MLTLSVSVWAGSTSFDVNLACSINEAFLPVLFNCGASRSGQSVSMSKEVPDSSLDEPQDYVTVAGSYIDKLTPEVEVTVAPQPVPSMEEGQLASNGHSAFLIEDTFIWFSISWGN